MDLLLAACAALVLGWWLGRRSRRVERRGAGPGLAQLRQWIQGAPGGWLIVDGEDDVRLINPRAERLLQVSDTTALSRPPVPRVPLAAVCPAPEVATLVRDARRLGRPQRLAWQPGEEDLELVALPGEQKWVAVLLQSRRSLEAQLEQQERWVSDVAHELKTPLTALLLVGDSLAARVTSGNVVLVERLQRELLRLQELVGDLLELSRLENTLPGGGLRQEAVDLAALLERVWSGLRPLAEQRGIRLEAPPAGLKVPGDPSRLHRVLLNLLDNAVRYSPDGGLVKVGLQRSPGWCRLSVLDQGPGLSEEDRQHLFERFYRGDPARVRSGRGGSGLGLAIVQQIVVTHGGRVQAGNHPDGGALLEVFLPWDEQAKVGG
jgi:two-component system phosphate regulon sensor histidine kinase PhoR